MMIQSFKSCSTRQNKTKILYNCVVENTRYRIVPKPLLCSSYYVVPICI